MAIAVYPPTFPLESTVEIDQVAPSYCACLRFPFVESRYEMWGFPLPSNASDE